MKFLQWLNGVRAVMQERLWTRNALDASLESNPWLWFNLFHSCPRDLRFAADNIEVWYCYASESL